VSIVSGSVKLTKLGDPAGNDGILLRGSLEFPAGTPAVFDPVTRGAQLRVEEVGGPLLLDLTSTSAIPPGAPGTGCAPKDGWKKTSYRNTSNALGAGCPAGSAQGLTLLKMKDKRAKGGGIAVKGLVRGTTLDTPAGPLRLTVVLGTDAAAGAAGECGVITFADGACALKKKTYGCK
jgi:hypothetical protein